MQIKISEEDFENLAKCITQLFVIYGNISDTIENDETRRKSILHFVKGGNACNDISKKRGQK